MWRVAEQQAGEVGGAGKVAESQGGKLSEITRGYYLFSEKGARQMVTGEP